MLRPCAPIGGSTWADSPTSATRWLANARGLSIVSGNRLRPGSTLTRPRMRMRLLFGGVRQFVVAERHQPLGFLRGRYPDHAAAVAGQGNEHARTVRRVELGRDVLVRAGMGDVEGQRRLMEVAALDVDAGGLARRRLPSIRADHQARGQRLALRVWIETSASCGSIVAASSSNRVRGRKARRRAPQVPPSASGCRCCSRTASRPISSRRKPHLRRADQPAGVVDKAHGLQRRGLIAAAPPDIQPFEQTRWTRPAAPWCGCRHRARGGRAARSCAPVSASAMAAVRPAGPPPMTMAS